MIFNSLLSLLVLISLSHFHTAKAGTISKGRQVYISLVKKGEVQTFLNRASTSENHIVATLKPTKNPIKQFIVEEEFGKQLHFVEVIKKNSRKIPGEIIRFERIALVASEKKHKHRHGPPYHYWEAISAYETNYKSYKNDNKSITRILSDPNNTSKKITIDQEFLEEKMKEFTGVKEIILDNNKIFLNERKSKNGRKNALAYLQHEYEKLGFQVTYHTYSDYFYSGKNIIAEKKGTDPSKYLIISAHFDTVRTPGADDDASGIIAGLTIAKALKDVDLKYSLRVLGFDQEERGLIGSKNYAKFLDEEGDMNKLLGLIQIEMIAWDQDKDKAIHVIDCDENISNKLSQAVLSVIQREGLNLQNIEACTNRSDHASFWKYNKPAIVISQNFFGGDSNPCYHRSCDKFDRIDLEYMKGISQAITNTVYDIVGH